MFFTVFCVNRENIILNNWYDKIVKKGIKNHTLYFLKYLFSVAVILNFQFNANSEHNVKDGKTIFMLQTEINIK